MERFTGPIGLLVVVLIGIATVLLIANMNKRIKGLPREFPQQEQQRRDDTPDGGTPPA